MPEKIYDDNGHTYYSIINVDTNNMPGSHWVAIAGLPNSKKIMVFDSFGRASNTLLPALKQKYVINTDSDAEQRKIQNSCGQFCIAWLVFLNKYGFDKAKMI